MLNLLFGLVLTSAIGIADISGNDIPDDEPIMLTSEITNDATNQDIVNSIDTTNELLNTLFDPILLENTNPFPFSFSMNEPNVPYLGVSANKIAYRTSNEYSFYLSFALTKGSSISITLPNFCSAYYSNSLELGTSATELIYTGNNNSYDLEFTAPYDVYITIFKTKGNNSPLFLSGTLTTLVPKTYSFSDIGIKLDSQERQLDNITFCVVILAFYPMLQDIIKKLGFRKELK